MATKKKYRVDPRCMTRCGHTDEQHVAMWQAAYRKGARAGLKRIHWDTNPYRNHHRELESAWLTGRAAGLIRAEKREQARREPKPSMETDSVWLSTQRKVGSYPAHTARGGKWLVFVAADAVDDVWRTIKRAVEAGKLGEFAKVSTAKPNQHSTDPSRHVICVHTYDATDTADVQQIRSALRELGVTGTIPYKTDDAGRQGKYRKSGHRGISLYSE